MHVCLGAHGDGGHALVSIFVFRNNFPTDLSGVLLMLRAHLVLTGFSPLFSTLSEMEELSSASLERSADKKHVVDCRGHSMRPWQMA